MKAPRSETVNRVLRNPKARAALFKALRGQDEASTGEETRVETEELTVVLRKRADGDVVIKSVRSKHPERHESLASSG